MTLTGPFVCLCFFFLSLEKVHGVHQLSSPAGDEEWEIRPGLQTVPEDDPSGQSQACYPGQQLPSSQVGAVLIASSLQLEPTGSSPQPPYFPLLMEAQISMLLLYDCIQSRYSMVCNYVFTWGSWKEGFPGADRLQKGIFKKT